jgi:hypothetical protein
MMEREASASAVVATDSASVNADYDNGAAVRGTRASRGAVSVRMVAQQRGLQGYGSSMGETNVYGVPAPDTS